MQHRGRLVHHPFDQAEVLLPPPSTMYVAQRSTGFPAKPIQGTRPESSRRIRATAPSDDRKRKFAARDRRIFRWPRRRPVPYRPLERRALAASNSSPRSMACGIVGCRRNKMAASKGKPDRWAARSLHMPAGGLVHQRHETSAPRCGRAICRQIPVRGLAGINQMGPDAALAP